MSPDPFDRVGEGRTVFTCFRRVAQSSPQAPALTFDRQTVTYGELLAQVQRCAASLREHGCGPGVAVAVILPNEPDFVVLTLATFAVGSILVPINPRFKDDEIRHCLHTSRPRMVFRLPALAGLVQDVLGPDALQASSAAVYSADDARLDDPAERPGDPALYMFSSGSTGKSKRVTRTQSQLLAEFDALARSAAITSDDRFLCTVPLFHAHGFCNAMLAALLSGASLVIDAAEFNARRVMHLLQSEAITAYPAVPFMIKMLCDTRFATPPDLSRLRLAFTAGAALPEAVASGFNERYGRTVGQLYGSTESGAITLNVARQADKPSSVGLPLHGFEIQIRGGGGQLLGAGEPGEIWIRTPATTHQYDGLPELSREHFHDGYFFAGDLGMLDAEGYLYVTGRKKLLINVAGYKVDPLEVEAALARHPKVAESVVVGEPHPGYGERIKAVIVLREGATHEGGDEFVDFLSSQLVAYKLPKVVEFRAEIPRSQLGKVLRKYL